MDRPPLEVADIVRAAGDTFIERNRKWLRWMHVKVLLAIARCRTAALGGHLDECTRCRHRAISFNSCRNRHCPKCQARARERWIAARRRELLPTRYLHVVFTLPHRLGATGPAEQEDPLRSPVSHQRGNTSRSRSRSETPRRGNWFLQCAAHLESEAQHAPACPLRRSRRRPLARSHPLGSLTRKLLRSQTGAAESLSRQIRRRAQASFSERPTQLPWRPEAPSSAQDLRCLAAATLSTNLGGVLEASLRWPRIRAPVSGPLYPSGGHLQPSPGLLCRWPSHFSLARFRRPQQTEVADPTCR